MLALEELHKNNIIYRDLKPDNVVIDEEGHLRLTDFGLSKEGIDDEFGTKSFCGSTAYLAPEVILRSGHGKPVDWYLLGVLIYEMLTGIPPFYSKDKKKMMKKIIKNSLIVPAFISLDARNILETLLMKDPKSRLGSGKLDAASIKAHPWFKDIDWDDVYNRKLQVPPMYTGAPPEDKNTDMKNHVNIIKGIDSSSKRITTSNLHIEDWSFYDASDQKHKYSY